MCFGLVSGVQYATRYYKDYVYLNRNYPDILAEFIGKRVADRDLKIDPKKPAKDVEVAFIMHRTKIIEYQAGIKKTPNILTMLWASILTAVLYGVKDAAVGFFYGIPDVFNGSMSWWENIGKAKKKEADSEMKMYNPKKLITTIKKWYKETPIVLIVDDEKDVRNKIIMDIKSQYKYQYKILEASNGEEALEIVKKHRRLKGIRRERSINPHLRKA